MNYDIEMLRRNLLHSQYEAAQSIRQACHENGLSMAMTVAVAYKAGYTAGRRSGKGNVSKVFQERDELRERINALEAESTETENDMITEAENE